MIRYFRFTDGGVVWPERKVGDGDRPHAKQVVVIDPEDREQVERLLAAWDALAEVSFPVGDLPLTPRGYRMQAALREFANPTPPKPDEPTGQFAVVEDVNGGRWVNFRDPNSHVHHERPWVSGGDVDEYREYVDIAAVRVLSEGVVQS